MIVGVDFGAPQRARDQRRKIIAIAAHSTGWHSYRIDAIRSESQAGRTRCRKGRRRTPPLPTHLA